jgi:hypothetical protein
LGPLSSSCTIHSSGVAQLGQNRKADMMILF